MIITIMLYFVVIVIIRSDVIFASHVMNFGSAEMKEYCQLEDFETTCPTDHVMLVSSARYGRMRVGKCVKKNYGHLGCQVEVTNHVDRICSGRSSCEFKVAILHVFNTCPGDLTPYLEISFSCVAVATAYEQQCGNQRPLVINVPPPPVSSPQQSPSSSSSSSSSPTTPTPSQRRQSTLSLAGNTINTSHTFSIANNNFNYLSNYLTIASGRGGQDCPWQLKVTPGLQINVTLVNFATSPPEFDWTPSLTSSSRHNTCYHLAVFREMGEKKKLLTACEGTARLVHAYLSSTHALEVEIQPNKINDVYFLLAYQATGCANPILNHLSILKRRENFAIIKCNTSRQQQQHQQQHHQQQHHQQQHQQVQRIECVNNVWVGDYTNCTTHSLTGNPISPADAMRDDFWSVGGLFANDSFPYSILLVVSVGVALGVFIGGVLLVCTTKFLKRRQNHYENNNASNNNSDNNNDVINDGALLHLHQHHHHDYNTPSHPLKPHPFHHHNHQQQPPQVLPPSLHHHHHHSNDFESLYRPGMAVDKLGTPTNCDPRKNPTTNPCNLSLTEIKHNNINKSCSSVDNFNSSSCFSSDNINNVFNNDVSFQQPFNVDNKQPLNTATTTSTTAKSNDYDKTAMLRKSPPHFQQQKTQHHNIQQQQQHMNNTPTTSTTDSNTSNNFNNFVIVGSASGLKNDSLFCGVDCYASTYKTCPLDLA